MKVKGFTLLEIVVVIGILLILAVSAFVVINPEKRVIQAYNTQRNLDIQNLYAAAKRYSLEKSLPNTITTIPKTIGTNASSNPNEFIDLSFLTPDYIEKIPFDPETGSAGDTKYTIYKGMGNMLFISAPHPGNIQRFRVGGPDYDLKFSGSGYGTFPTIPGTTGGSTGLTVSAWVKLAQSASGDYTIMSGDGVKMGALYNYPCNASFIGFWQYITTNNGTVQLTTPCEYQPDTWYHVTYIIGTENNGTQKIYINGNLKVQKLGSAGAETFSSFGGLGTLGGSQFNGISPPTARFHGEIDEVRVYNRALTDTEVALLYSLENVNTGLMAYWNFDLGIGTTVQDISGNNRTITLPSATDPSWFERK